MKDALNKLKNAFEELSKLTDQIRQELYAARMGKLSFARKISSLYMKIYFAGLGIGLGLAITGAVLCNGELRYFGWGIALIVLISTTAFNHRFWKHYEQTENSQNNNSH